MSIPGSLSGPTATLNAIFPPKGSRWGAFSTAHLQGLFLGGETPIGPWAGWTAPFWGPEWAELESGVWGREACGMQPSPQHSEASLRGIIEYISPKAHSALPL